MEISWAKQQHKFKSKQVSRSLMTNLFLLAVTIPVLGALIKKLSCLPLKFRLRKRNLRKFKRKYMGKKVKVKGSKLN